MRQITAADLRVGDFLWRTPASESYIVTSVTRVGDTVEITGMPEGPERGLSSGRNWYAADEPVHIGVAR